MTFSINLFYWFSTWQYIQKQVFGNKVNQNPYLRSVFENEIRTELCRGTFDAIIVEMTYSFVLFFECRIAMEWKSVLTTPQTPSNLEFYRFNFQKIRNRRISDNASFHHSKSMIDVLFIYLNMDPNPLII